MDEKIVNTQPNSKPFYRKNIVKGARNLFNRLFRAEDEIPEVQNSRSNGSTPNFRRASPQKLESVLSGLQLPRKIDMVEGDDAVNMQESHFILPQDMPMSMDYLEDDEISQAYNDMQRSLSGGLFLPIGARTAPGTPRMSPHRNTPSAGRTTVSSVSPRSVSDSGKFVYRLSSSSPTTPPTGDRLECTSCELEFEQNSIESSSVGTPSSIDESSHVIVGEDGYPLIEKDGPLYAKYRYDMSLIIRAWRDVSETLEMCSPDLDPKSVFDKLPGGGRIYLGDQKYSGKMTTVFSLPSSRGIIAKYQSDCFEGRAGEEEDVHHPLVKDFLMLKEVKSIDVSPRAFYVSPPTTKWPEKLPRYTFSKASFTMSDSEFAKCKSKSSSIRLMLIEEVDMSFWDLHDESPPPGFVNSVSMGIEMIETLRKLHEIKGIVHGDIHSGNFVLHGGRVKVIDFGRSYFDIPKDMGKKSVELIRKKYSVSHPFFTHWEIEGYKNAKRDDIYKALLVLTELINGPSVSEYFRRRNMNLSEMYVAKADRNIFVLHDLTNNTLVGDPVAALGNGVADDHKADIRSTLALILDHVRGLGFYDVPDYSLIITSLCQIRDGLDNHKVSMELYNDSYASAICHNR